MGVFSNALPFALLSWGQRHVTSGFAGITMAVVPLLVLPLAHLFVPGERMTARKVAGFVVGFAGVVLLIGTGGPSPAARALARLACVAASSCYAVGAIVTRLAPPRPLRSRSPPAACSSRRRCILPLALASRAGPGGPPRRRSGCSTSASSRPRSPRCSWSSSSSRPGRRSSAW